MNVFNTTKPKKIKKPRMKKITKKPKMCVITLTHNRPEYIERSFESLYKRAGMRFDHFVFDDCSDQHTQNKLIELKEKYNFNLFLNKKRVDIYRRLYYSLFNIPIDYEYYMKFDSDVEILTDNFFPEMLEVFSFPEIVGGAMPRIEGIRNVDRYDKRMDFYNGHTIKYNAAAVSGCCMIFPNRTFTSFDRKTLEELEHIDLKWGVDSVMYDHARKIGLFLGVEDVSVYHIDNAYGQRRVNDKYFSDRKRWNNVDIEEVWHMKVTKTYAPGYIDRMMLDRIKKRSTDYEEYVYNCKQYLIDNSKETKTSEAKDGIWMKKEVRESEKPLYLEKMYKITSPMNFRKDTNIPQGTSRYYTEVPDWARNNPRLVVESEDIPMNEEDSIAMEVKEEKEKIEACVSENKKDIMLHITENNGKIKRYCAQCEYETYSEKSLEKHIEEEHRHNINVG